MDAVKKPGFWSTLFYALAMNLAIRWLATGAATGPKSLPIWLIAAAFFLAPLIFATLDLSARYPKDGAIYAWTRETQGPFAGFMCGWLYWSCNLPYFAGLLIFIVNLLGKLVGGDVGVWVQSPFGTFSISTVLVAVVALLHAAGLGIGKWIPVAGAAATLILYGFLVGAGFFFGAHNGSATDFAHADYLPPISGDGAILWSTMIFAYGGAEGVALLRNEIKGGIKTLTTALLMLAVILAVAFAAGTAAMLMIIPQDLASRARRPARSPDPGGGQAQSRRSRPVAAGHTGAQPAGRPQFVVRRGGAPAVRRRHRQIPARGAGQDRSEDRRAGRRHLGPDFPGHRVAGPQPVRRHRGQGLRFHRRDERPVLHHPLCLHVHRLLEGADGAQSVAAMGAGGSSPWSWRPSVSWWYGAPSCAAWCRSPTRTTWSPSPWLACLRCSATGGRPSS
ncbi:MAG: amino acid permease [Asticcacaulis sp.]